MKHRFFTVYQDDDSELLIEYTRTPYDPGRLSGPPEDCYPPEGGDVEIINVYAIGAGGTRSVYAATDAQLDEWATEIEQSPSEEDGPDPDELYDRMRDERMEFDGYL